MPGQRLSAQVRQWSRTFRKVVNTITIKEQKATNDLICFCVPGKDQSLTATSLDGGARTMPFPTIKPKCSVSRLTFDHFNTYFFIS
jgi:hypothetical protein